MPILDCPTPRTEEPVRLFARTIALDTQPALAESIPHNAAAVWLSGETSMLAVGEVWRAEARGNERFASIREKFSHLAQNATIECDSPVRGAGLTAFGSFSYSASSPRPSTLIVPRAILGKGPLGAFLTEISTETMPELDAERVGQLLEEFTLPPATSVGARSMQSAHSPESYRGKVKDAVQLIDDQKAQKIVLSERFRIDLGTTSARSIIPALARTLHKRYPHAWTFAFNDLIGASPEMLAQLDSGRVFSRVLAGSRPVADGDQLTASEQQAFLNDPKERSEHDYAAASVREPLEALGVKLTDSTGPFVLQLPGIEHLASDMRGEAPEHLSIVDVIERLHPSAAVSGTPREAADRFIAELEGVDRGGYAAPVGWINASGDGEFAIALRMAHVEENALVVQAGGGLVSASDPLTEHAEALAKTRPITRALNELAGEEAEVAGLERNGE